MMIYLAIIEDRHFDVDVTPFRECGNAIAHIKEAVRQLKHEVYMIDEDAEPTGNILYHCIYSVEGDKAYVVQSELVSDNSC